MNFYGYKRPDGRVGVRNKVLILPASVCASDLPYSLFEFIKLGKEGQIRNFGTSTDSYLEAAFSYSFPLMDDRLYIGIRGKFLAGLARAQVTYDRFDISLREDRWAVLTQGTLDLTAAGAKVETDPDSETFEIGDLDFKPTKPAGYGFALDLGATYDILPNLQASLAVTDLGFISWSKKNSVMGVSTQETEFTGATVPENASEPSWLAGTRPTKTKTPKEPSS